MFCYSLAKVDAQLAHCLTPVVDWHVPFLADVHDNQVHQLEQGVVGGKCAFGLGDLAHNPIEALNRVCRIHDASDLWGVLEEGA